MKVCHTLCIPGLISKGRVDHDGARVLKIGRRWLPVNMLLRPCAPGLACRSGRWAWRAGLRRNLGAWLRYAPQSNKLPTYRSIYMQQTLFVPTAQAAFIADLTDREMNRVMDEHLVPENLVERQGKNRMFTPLAAAFARFYFSSEDLLVANARKQVIEELSCRVVQLKSRRNEVLALKAPLDIVSWKVEVKKHFLTVDLTPFLVAAFQRVAEVYQAESLVSTDPEVMGGTPVFAGTRVPLDVVLASLAEGISMERLKNSYPFLTEAHINAAKVYETVRPRRGRPRRLSELNPKLPRKVTRVVKRVDLQ